MVLFIKYRDKSSAFSFVVIFSISLAWILFAANNVVGFDYWVNSDKPLINFNFDLSRILMLIMNTIINPEILIFSVKSFIGIIGWLDSPLNNFQYKVIAIFLIILFFISQDLKRIKYFFLSSKFLILTSIFFSLFMMFILLIFTATSASSSVIEGIQGRYFIPLILVFSLLLEQKFKNETTTKILLILFIVTDACRVP